MEGIYEENEAQIVFIYLYSYRCKLGGLWDCGRKAKNPDHTWDSNYGLLIVREVRVQTTAPPWTPKTDASSEI